MRVFLLLLITGLTNAALADTRHNGIAMSRAVVNRRQFLFPGLGYPPGPAAITTTPTTEPASEAPTTPAFEPFLPLGPTKAKEKEGKEVSSTATATSAQSSTTTPTTAQTTSSSPPASSPTEPHPGTPPSPTPDAGHQSNPSSQASSGTSEWKVVCVAVIAFSAVAAILLIAVFFDQCWGFARDVFGRHKVRDGAEELVPDWEKASWEVRFGDDRHRYPSFASVPPSAPKARAGAEAPFGIRPLSVLGRDASAPHPAASSSARVAAQSPQYQGDASVQPVLAAPVRDVGSQPTRQRSTSKSSRPKSTMPEDVYGGIDE
ncbi:hypothetical protein OBBRIDRAFT_212519 [Obba rivulosa]|uniref:Transmembrane protein n=1 Tax=Obba rivulosa TaxID=1052685 RepID=A0A8E2AL88_9APHY|nr:hypothetical protein OBBRIDRAFT_212519 [Obba rivulosa]